MSASKPSASAIPQSVIDDAVASLRAAKDKEDGKRVAEGKDITSLNRLLQWGAANSAPPADDATGENEADTKQPSTEADAERIRKDREWLDAAFPDMFGGIKRLADILAGKPVKRMDGDGKETIELDDGMRVEVLNEIEEYMADLNYATNITKLGVLDTVLKHTAHENASVRAAAFWVLGTAVQDFPEAKAQVVAGGAVPMLVAGLSDSDMQPRAKACMAVSSLLKHASPSIIDTFRSSGGAAPLRKALTDDSAQIRRRVMFFVEHAHVSGNDWFVDDVAADEATLTALVKSLEQVDVSECDQIEQICGALDAIAAHDRTSLVDVAPHLPGVLDRLARGVSDSETRERVAALSNRILPALG